MLNIKHLKPKTQTFDGIYRGVVENNVDPEKLGRVQARIFGIHNDLLTEKDKGGISTENLPWSEPCNSIFEGSVSGNGIFCVPLQGSHIFIFFEGGNWCSPRYFASAPGIPVTGPDTNLGFNDPSGNYPSVTGIPDTHCLYRNVDVDVTGTLMKYKSDNRITGIIIATTGTEEESWDEPVSAYNKDEVIHTENIVISTHSGITIEIDNTPDYERVHLYHPSGTYIEIDAGGNVVFKNSGDRFDITKAKYYRTSDENILHTTGNESNYIGGNWTIQVEGDVNLSIKGDTFINSQGVIDITNEGYTSVESKGDVTIKSEGDITIDNTNGGNIDIKSDGDINLSSGSSTAVLSSDSFVVESTTIDLNSSVITLGGITWGTHIHGISPPPSDPV